MTFQIYIVKGTDIKKVKRIFCEKCYSEYHYALSSLCRKCLKEGKEVPLSIIKIEEEENER